MLSLLSMALLGACTRGERASRATVGGLAAPAVRGLEVAAQLAEVHPSRTRVAVGLGQFVARLVISDDAHRLVGEGLPHALRQRAEKLLEIALRDVRLDLHAKGLLVADHRVGDVLVAGILF